MFKSLTVVATGLVWVGLTVLASGSAIAKPIETVELTAKYGSKNKRKHTGTLSLRTKFKVTDDAEGAPPPLTRVVLRFPKGAVANGKRFPKCSRDKVFNTAGRSCRQALLGRGTAAATAPPIVANVNAKVSLFNGSSSNGNQSIVIFAIPEIGPNLALQGTLKKGRGTPYGYLLDNEIPPIQTLPGAPNASVTGFDATVRDVTTGKRRHKRHFIDAPLLCNGTFFLLDGEFSYENGISNTVYERFTLRGGPRCP